MEHLRQARRKIEEHHQLQYMIKRYAKDTKLVIELSIIDTIFSMNIFLTLFTFCYIYKSQERSIPSIFDFKHGEDNERKLRTINQQLSSAVDRANKLRKKLAEAEEDNALGEIEDLKERIKKCAKDTSMWTDILLKFHSDKDAYEKLVPRGDKKKIVGKEKYFDLLFQIKHTIVNQHC